jgi:hypothetical protein
VGFVASAGLFAASVGVIIAVFSTTGLLSTTPVFGDSLGALTSVSFDPTPSMGRDCRSGFPRLYENFL